MDGSVDSGSDSDVINYNEIFGYDEEDNLNSPIPSPIDDGEVVDVEVAEDFSSLSLDLLSEDLNVSHEPFMGNILNYDSFPPVPPPINGEAVDDASSWDSLQKLFLDDDSWNDMQAVNFNDNTLMENMHSVEPKAADESEVQSELKTTEVDEHCEAEASELLIEQPKEHQMKLQIKVPKSRNKRRKKAHYKRKGISLRLSRRKFGI
ncbi:unnamed protein product [Rhodiola kirilowii]